MTRKIDALEEAWRIIANASDWDLPDQEEWRQAAERFRDGTWHPALAAYCRRSPREWLFRFRARREYFRTAS